jgi:phosphatidate phosphatase APP1
MAPAVSPKSELRVVTCALTAACLLWAGESAASPALWIFPAVGRPSSVTVSGRVLKETPHGHHVLSRNLRDLTAEKWGGAPVELQLEGQTVKQTSSDDGDFTVTFTFKEQPLEPGIHFVEGRVPGATGKVGVQVLEDAAPFLLVSDLDDTLSVTNVLQKDKLVKAALLEDGESQPAVPGMAAFYRCLTRDKPAAPGIAVVTGTPIQYVPRTQTFLSRNGFPFSAIYPRHLGATTWRDYKQPVIRRLFHELPEKALCVGDTGEQDPEVYGQMRKEFPDRILRIYIHNVGRDEDPSRFTGMVLFKEAREAARDAVANGYMTQACLDEEFSAGAAPQ